MANVKNINAIKIAECEKPAKEAVTDDSLKAHRETVVSGEIVLLPCWKESNKYVTENEAMEGVFRNLHNDPVLDAEGKEITFSVEEHFHKGHFVGGLVINNHAYLERGAILGQTGDCVVVEMGMEKVQKLWNIFHIALGIILGAKFTALVRLEKVLTEVKVVMDCAAESLYAESLEDIEKYISIAQAMAKEAFAENCEDLAEKAEMEFKRVFEMLKFHSEVFPISYYSVSKEKFLKVLKEGNLRKSIFRPGEISKADDCCSFVQENPFKNASTTIVLRKFSEQEMEKILDRLYLQREIEKDEIESILSDLYPDDKEQLPDGGFAADGE